MNKRPSIYIGSALEGAIEQRQTEATSTSGIINSIAERYVTMINRSMPTLKRNEWLAIFEALSGINTKPITQAVNGLAGNIRDGIELNTLGTKWLLEDGLAEYITNLVWIQKLAVIDTSECFWAEYERTDNVDTALSLSGAKVS